ncbi:MAG: GspH/FimT family pseudopilin [Pseudomonadota bacterium]
MITRTTTLSGGLRHTGITLPELLVTLSVLATLLLFAVPAFDGLLARERRTAAMNQVLGAVQFARAAAIRFRSRTLLCPGAGTPAPRCGARDHWHAGALVFLDRNGNGRREASEDVLLRLPGWTDGGRIRWRAFRNRSYLAFRPQGVTDWQNGAFTWCPPPEDDTAPLQVVLNGAGRTRTAQDLDGDGIPENSRGEPVRC